MISSLINACKTRSTYALLLSSGLRRGTYHRRCLRALRQLSAKYEILPSSLVIQDVEREGHNPVAGGGFAVSAFVISRCTRLLDIVPLQGYMARNCETPNRMFEGS